MGTVSFPGVKSERGVTLTPHPLLVPWQRKGRAITLLALWAVRPVQSLSACTRVHFTFLPLCMNIGNMPRLQVTHLSCMFAVLILPIFLQEGRYIVKRGEQVGKTQNTAISGVL